MTDNRPPRVGQIRPSQLMYTYGVGAIVDLPKFSVIVAGLEDWPKRDYSEPISETRLLRAVRYKYPTVNELRAAPLVPESAGVSNPFTNYGGIGVPVAVFPRWMVCPACRRLAPLSSGLFEIPPKNINPAQPERAAFVHINCNKAKKPPEVIPARFLIACSMGHLDDFPWIHFVHQGAPCDNPRLKLIEYGASGEAVDLEVRCETCSKKRRLSEAFGQDKQQNLPQCNGRRPHLRDYDSNECFNKVRTIILGASNAWFPVVLSTIAIPVGANRLQQLVDEQWMTLRPITSIEILEAFRISGQIGGDYADYTNNEIWKAIQEQRVQETEDEETNEKIDLKQPEWNVFTQFDQNLNSTDFYLTQTDLRRDFSHNEYINNVILVERLREVRAMIGFTRLDAIGELTDPDRGLEIDPAPITRKEPQWIPSYEIRGEGIFIQFDEDRMRDWLSTPEVKTRSQQFFESHQKWRQTRKIEPIIDGFPGMRYVFLHTFSHALMRQLSLECGYSAASIRERIYSRNHTDDGGPMAGILLYTSAPDSEGTLGGLVYQGQPKLLQEIILRALNEAKLCASDPICAERPPSQTGRTLHAAACHTCLFSPETSCERGNKYLDRNVLIPTVSNRELNYFDG